MFAYGGQSYLQALVLAFSTVSRIVVLDNGICVLVLAGLVVGWVRERPRFPFAVAVPALLGLLTLHYYDFNHNAASEFSGAVFFLAMFRVLDRPRRAGESAWANALALALVASAACTLRQSNLAAAALIPAAYYGLRMVRERDARRRWAQEAALAALFSLALLVPWMVLTYRSCGTPLYPLILGQRRQKPPWFRSHFRSHPISAVEKARYFVMASLYQGRLPGLLLAFTAGLLVPSRASLCATRVARRHRIGHNHALQRLGIRAPDRRHRSIPLPVWARLLPRRIAHRRRGGGASHNEARPLRDRHDPGRLRAGAAAVPDAAATSCGSTSTTPTTARPRWRIPPDPTSIPATLSMLPSNALSRSTPRSSSCSISLFVSTSSGTASFRGMSQAPSAPRLTYPSARAQTPWLGISSARASATSPTATGPRQITCRDVQLQALYRLGQGVRYVAYCDRGPSPEYPPTPNRVVADLEKLTATRKQLYADNGTYVLDLATPAPPPP